MSERRVHGFRQTGLAGGRVYLGSMRFTRHAKNRLRWLRRSYPGLSRIGIIAALDGGRMLGLDWQGRRKVAITLGSVDLVVVVDTARGVVVTLWKEAP